ncbi:hypothetical protein GC176_23950 [bacterium]|nr:hypothetical protein [bacterium]
MNLWQTGVVIFDAFWNWCAETGATTLTFQASAAVFIVCLIRQRGRFTWPKDAFTSCFANVLMTLVNGAFAPAFAAVMGLLVDAYAWLSFPCLDRTIWQGISPWFSIPLILLAIDFADYWNHRLMHVSKWFWPVHAIHHSDPHPTVLTVGRVHLFEPAVMQFSYLLLLTWLSLPYEVLGGVAGLRILHNMYIHMNLDWDHGPFKYLIASPRFHRWHHADKPAAYGKNLANLFPFYDVLFRTYYAPGTCDVSVGARGVPTTALKMVAWPFQEWARLVRTSVTRTRPVGSLEKLPASNHEERPETPISLSAV